MPLKIVLQRGFTVDYVMEGGGRVKVGGTPGRRRRKGLDQLEDKL